MIKKTIKCPNCGDTWEYNMVVDHGNGRVLVTKDYHFLEEGQECTCFKCHKPYRLEINSPSDIKMDDFIYNVWRKCKM